MSTMKTSTEHPALACDLLTLTPTQADRHRTLLMDLRSSCREARELPDGIALCFQRDAILRAKLEEWVTYERICCPFLTLSFAGDGDDACIWLHMTGGAGVKNFLHGTFGRWAP